MSRRQGMTARLVGIALLSVAALVLAGAGPVAAQEAAHAPATVQEPEHPEAGQEPEHAIAPAQEGDHGEEEHGAEHEPPSWTEYAFRWINFVLLAALLWWLLVKPPAFVVENFEFAGLAVILAQRGNEIVESRDLAHEQAAAAKANLADSEARLKRVEEEVAALLSEAEGDAEKERQRIVAAAEQEAGRIREHAQRDMSAEVSRARRQLKRHVADLSVGIAASILKDNLSAQDQDRLVREYLDRLGQTVA